MPDLKPFPRLVVVAAASALMALVSACGGGSAVAPSPPRAELTRSWRMGFFTVPPRPSVAAAIESIDRWSLRAELVAIHEELPWTELLAGVAPETILARDKVDLVNYLRSKGLAIYFMLDLTDGLSRGEEAPQLRALGRSIADPEVQQAYRSYALAVASVLNPEIIGLAAETNLIRVAAPAPVYAAVVQVTNATASDLKSAGSQATLLVSTQVEVAWGGLGGNGPYVGIERDFADFPFMEMLGLSSYPYFDFTQPENLPVDYYSRLRNGRTIPVMVVEGGWTSAAVGNVQSSPALQARYFNQHARLLDSVAARGVIQLIYADIDLAAIPPPLPVNLPLFVHLGLTDSDFNAKPALAAWDALYARPLRP